jgi:demethylmenaquinone methyltransferase/2-methoxy-6-polyprenyl-1,4-benzoquinol methylase
MQGYYEQRAPEYDDWYLGTGVFAARDRPGWHAEVVSLQACWPSSLPYARSTSPAGPASSPATCTER